MKKIKIIIPLLSIFLLGIISCQKLIIVSPGLSYKVQTTNRTYNINGISGTNTTGNITWTEGYANVNEIQFEGQNANSRVKFNSNAVQKIDLFAPISPLGNVLIPTGSYSQTEFKIELTTNSTTNAFKLVGNYDGIPVMFNLNGDYELDAEMSNLTVTKEIIYSAINTIDLSKITTGINSTDLNNADKDNTGSIVISANSNISLYNILVANLHKSVEHVDVQ